MRTVVASVALAIALAAPLAAALAGGAAGSARDWKAAPAVLVVDPAPARIVAIGDIHGDAERALDLLARTGVIAAAPTSAAAARWTAGAATLVCTGDVIDKYTSSLEAIALLRALEPQAAAAGGRVVVELGNHEAEFLAGGGKNKKGAEFEAELKAAGLAPADVAAGTDAAGIGAWLRARPAAARLGDWFFCHAGDTGGLTADELEKKIEQGVDQDGYATQALVGATSLLEARLHPHPWWETPGRPKVHGGKKHPKASGGAATPTADEVELEGVVTSLGAKHLVMGHQPGEVKFSDKTKRPADAPFQKFDGLIFFIDCGMSRGVDGAVGAVLDIDTAGAKATARFADGRSVALLP